MTGLRVGENVRIYLFIRFDKIPMCDAQTERRTEIRYAHQHRLSDACKKYNRALFFFWGGGDMVNFYA